MPLTNEQRARLTAEAQRRGIDPAELITAAEQQSPPGDGQSSNGQSAPAGEQPKLFMYLLPFVTVREVREKWLGLTDSFAGDREVASAWAAKQGPAPSGGSDPDAA